MKNTTKIVLTALAIVFAMSVGFFFPMANTAVAYKSQITLANANFESELLSSGWAVSGTKQDDVTLEKSTTAHGGDYSLVISHSQEINYGAKTTYTTKLEANKYYLLSVWAKVDSASTKFSYGFSGDFAKEITISPSSTDWTEYSLYVETNSTTEANVAIELWLGSKDGETKSSGAVYFDDVNLYNIDRAQYIKAKADGKTAISNQDVFDSATTDIKLLNGDESLKWSFSVADGETSETQSAVPTNYTFNEGTDIEYTTKVVLAKNSSSAKTFSLKSGDFALQKLSLYRISILVKADSDTAKFDLKLSNGTTTKTQTISSLSKSTTNNTFDNYTEYVFFVRTGVTDANNCTLSISLKSVSTIYIYNPKVENTTYEKFTEAAATKKLDLAASANDTISNGHFNQTQSNDVAPHKAALWETFGEAQSMGIIVPIDEHYTINGTQIDIPTCYKIESSSPTYSGIKSSSLSIKTSAPIAKVSVWVKTQNGANATIKLFQSTNLVAQSESISSESGWTQISFYIKAGKALTLNLQLALGESENSTSSGTVYFYAATLSSTTNEELFANQKAKNNANEYFWDDSSYFSHNGIKKNDVYQMYATSFKIETEQADSFGGTLDLEDMENIGDTSVFFAHKDNLKNPEGNFKGEYLALYLADNGSITATHMSGDTTKLTGYVKLQTKVKLIGSGASATITLGDLATFDVLADNQWHTLEVYIKSGSKTINTINPSFSLLGENSSIALFDEIKFSQSNESTYKAISSTDTIKKADLTSSSDDGSSAKPAKAKSSTNWTAVFFIALSSALLVGAVLVAVVARALKRLPKRTTINLPTSGYNKNKKSSKK